MKYLKKMLALFVVLLSCLTSNAYTVDDCIWDFEWLEPNNKVEIVVGEPYQLKFNSRTNIAKVFTSQYSECWNHYEFNPSQLLVNSPSGYTINEKGEITGLIPGSYAIAFTGLIQPKDGVDKWLFINVVNERSEIESNNTIDTANDVYTRIRFGLYNPSDIDFFKFTSNRINIGDYVTFKLHYYGNSDNPFGYKWSTFAYDGSVLSSGSLLSQDQECKALVTGGNCVYLEVYYNSLHNQYFNYGEEFVIEMYINGELVQYESSGNDETIEYVDLGLPSGTLWATCNLGSNSRYTPGDYYAWGEVSTKSEYTEYNYKWGTYGDYTKYVTNEEYGIVDGKLELDKEDDVAYIILGEGWRLPTLEEWEELSQYCSWTGYSNSSTNYNMITEGTGPNGNKIILPATGDIGGYGSSLWGFYWTKTTYTEDNNNFYAHGVQTCGEISYSGRAKYIGHNIRAVYDPNSTGISKISDSEKKIYCKKYLNNGQIEIINNNKVYNIRGFQIKRTQKGLRD